jgi:hypothetical protein
MDFVQVFLRLCPGPVLMAMRGIIKSLTMHRWLSPARKR